MNRVIRFADESDIEKMLSIYAPVIEQTVISFEYEVPTLDDFKSWVKKTFDQLPWLVCESEGELLGYAYASHHRVRKAYQWSVESSVYVDQQYHKQKIATSLYTSLFNILKVLRIYNVYAGITMPNEASVTFHKSFGFELIGIYKSIGFKKGQWHDVSWWQLALQDHLPSPAPPISLDQIRDLQEIHNALKSGEALRT